MGRHRPPTVRWRAPRRGESCGAFRINFQGVRREQATPYQRAADAEAERKTLELLLRERWAEGLGHAIRRPGPPPLSLQQLVERWVAEALVPPRVSLLTASCQARRARTFVEGVGGATPAHEVTTAIVEAWVTRRLAEPSRRGTTRGHRRNQKAAVSLTTVRNELVAARAAFRWAVRLRILPDAEGTGRPASAVPWEVTPPRGRTHRRASPIPTEHLRAIVTGAQIATRWGRAVYLEALLGLRAGDLAAMAWGDLDRAGILRLSTQKSREETALVLPLPPGVSCVLESYRESPENRITEVRGWASWRRATRRLCGVPYTVKDLRRAVATGLVESGAHPRVIKALMGHRLDVTEGYSTPWIETLREALSALPWCPERAESGGESGGGAKKYPSGGRLARH